jgi:hypothetical protein
MTAFVAVVVTVNAPTGREPTVAPFDAARTILQVAFVANVAPTEQVEAAAIAYSEGVTAMSLIVISEPVFFRTTAGFALDCAITT